MRLSHHHLRNRKSKVYLARTLENIRVALNLSHAEWADELLLSNKQYIRFRKNQIQIPLHSILHLSERYNFSLSALQKNEIDIKAIQAFKTGISQYIPEKYSIAPFSRFRTARVMFDFLEENFGFAVVQSIYRHFQIHPQLFNDLNGWINNIFFTDLFSHIEHTYTIPEDFYFRMGNHSTKTNYSTDLGNLYRQLPKVDLIFERLFGEFMPFYEKNSDYQILKLNRDQCVIKTRTKKEVGEALSLRHLGNTSICQWKAGVFATAPGYLELKNAKVYETHCVHRGDPSCVFQINYGHLPKPQFLFQRDQQIQ